MKCKFILCKCPRAGKLTVGKVTKRFRHLQTCSTSHTMFLSSAQLSITLVFQEAEKGKGKKNVFSLIKLAPESCTYPEPRSMDLPTHYAVTCRGDWELLSVFQTMGQQTLSLKDQVVVNISSLAGCITSHIEYSDSLLLWVFFLSYLS